MNQQKLMIGPRVRQLRQSLKLTQAAMAEDIGISTSYMNLIERNQRPMSAKVLLRMAEIYEIDLATLSPESDSKLVQELGVVLDNPTYGSFKISKAELRDSIGVSPDLARAFIALHKRAEALTVNASMRNDPLADRERVELLEESVGEVENVRQFIHSNQNYFDELDRAAEKLARDIGPKSRQPNTTLTKHLLSKHGIDVRIVPADIIPGRLSLFDPHRQLLRLSELLPQSGRRFRIAYELGLREHRSLIDAAVRKAILPTKEADDLARRNLANYFAAAVLMPYGKFLQAAQEMSYDVEMITRRFDTSYEQTAHRLTTLQRKGARGIPFFFVRVDMAGNISKRFSAGKFHFSRFGGACPLWNIHACFQTPGETIPQVIEMPDGTKYFSVARAVLRPEGAHGQHAQMAAIGLGCDLKHADKLVYAQGRGDMTPTPIGVNCYLCERTACRSRAMRQLTRSCSMMNALGISQFFALQIRPNNLRSYGV